MTEVRAGLIRLATVRVQRAGLDNPTLEAAGDEWINNDEIRRIRTESIATGGAPLVCTLIELKSGAVIRTAADIDTIVLPQIESARANVATAEFQPLVDNLQERQVSTA